MMRNEFDCFDKTQKRRHSLALKNSGGFDTIHMNEGL